MNLEKLKRLQTQVRIGGKGTPRRKKKVLHQTSATDDKKLQSSLKKLSVSTIPGIEEVNIIKNDLTVIHFNNPKAQASLSANTFAITGHGESKKVIDMLPEILPQLGQESVVQLRMFANSVTYGQKQAGNAEKGSNAVAVDDPNDDVPMLVEDFDELAKMEAIKQKNQLLKQAKPPETEAAPNLIDITAVNESADKIQITNTEMISSEIVNEEKDMEADKLAQSAQKQANRQVQTKPNEKSKLQVDKNNASGGQTKSVKPENAAKKPEPVENAKKTDAAAKKPEKINKKDQNVVTAPKTQTAAAKKPTQQPVKIETKATKTTEKTPKSSQAPKEATQQQQQPQQQQKKRENKINTTNIAAAKNTKSAGDMAPVAELSIQQLIKPESEKQSLDQTIPAAPIKQAIETASKTEVKSENITTIAAGGPDTIKVENKENKIVQQKKNAKSVKVDNNVVTEQTPTQVENLQADVVVQPLQSINVAPQKIVEESKANQNTELKLTAEDPLQVPLPPTIDTKITSSAQITSQKIDTPNLQTTTNIPENIEKVKPIDTLTAEPIKPIAAEAGKPGAVEKVQSEPVVIEAPKPATVALETPMPDTQKTADLETPMVLETPKPDNIALETVKPTTTVMETPKAEAAVVAAAQPDPLPVQSKPIPNVSDTSKPLTEASEAKKEIKNVEQQKAVETDDKIALPNKQISKPTDKSDNKSTKQNAPNQRKTSPQKQFSSKSAAQSDDKQQKAAATKQKTNAQQSKPQQQQGNAKPQAGNTGGSKAQKPAPTQPEKQSNVTTPTKSPEKNITPLKTSAVAPKPAQAKQPKKPSPPPTKSDEAPKTSNQKSTRQTHKNVETATAATAAAPAAQANIVPATKSINLPATDIIKVDANLASTESSTALLFSQAVTTPPSPQPATTPTLQAVTASPQLTTAAPQLTTAAPLLATVLAPVATASPPLATASPSAATTPLPQAAAPISLAASTASPPLAAATSPAAITTPKAATPPSSPSLVVGIEAINVVPTASVPKLESGNNLASADKN